MAFNQKVRNFIVKLQGLPESQRLIILWATVAIIGGLLFVLWLLSSSKSLSHFDQAIKNSGLPKIEMPQEVTNGWNQANNNINKTTEIVNGLNQQANQNNNTGQ